MISIKRYTDFDKEKWDDFVKKAKNGLFLYLRDYMDYHKERFNDHSLLIEKKNNIITVLPTNENNDTVYSHQGLTFGGLIMHPELRTIEVLQIFDEIISYFRRLNIKSIVYKPAPFPFHSYPSEEDLYALFKNEAKLISRSISSVLPIEQRMRFSESKRQSVNKILKMDVQFQESADFGEYWALLAEVLSYHDAKPVHSISEIEYLRRSFPDNIKLYEARFENRLLAGIVVYDYGNVVHTQYMANSQEGRKIGALDFINYKLINEVYHNRSYYDWGISTENGGQYLNEGLIQQKEMMGGRGILFDTYRIDIAK